MLLSFELDFGVKDLKYSKIVKKQERLIFLTKYQK